MMNDPASINMVLLYTIRSEFSDAFSEEGFGACECLLVDGMCRK